MDARKFDVGRVWERWLIAALGLAVIAACFFVEPMRWRLPVRYLITPLDIHRTGSLDYTMCMRAALSPEEMENFVSDAFSRADRVARPVSMDETKCPAAFWPRNFAEPTIGYAADYAANPLEGSRGAVYQNGYLYFWSNAR